MEKLLPYHPRYKRRCGREQCRESWPGPLRPEAELPVRLRSPMAYWVPRPPPLHKFNCTQNHNQQTYSQPTNHFMVPKTQHSIYTYAYTEREGNRSGEKEKERERLPLQVMTWPWVAMDLTETTKRNGEIDEMWGSECEDCSVCGVDKTSSNDELLPRIRGLKSVFRIGFPFLGPYDLLGLKEKWMTFELMKPQDLWADWDFIWSRRSFPSINPTHD